MDHGGYDWLLSIKVLEDKKGKSQPFMLRHLCCVPIPALCTPGKTELSAIRGDIVAYGRCLLAPLAGVGS